MVSSFIPKMPKFQAYQVSSKFTRIISFMKSAFQKKNLKCYEIIFVTIIFGDPSVGLLGYEDPVNVLGHY